MKPASAHLAFVFLSLALLSACATNAGRNEVLKRLENADRAYDAEDWRAAEDGYRALTTLVPNDAYAFFRLGNVLAKQTRYDEAAYAYQEALIRDASLIKAYSNLGMVRLLQAETAFSAVTSKARTSDGTTANARMMLKELRKITHIPVLESSSPAAANPNRDRTNQYQKQKSSENKTGATPHDHNQ